jgi:hypothetical protein
MSLDRQQLINHGWNLDVIVPGTVIMIWPSKAGCYMVKEKDGGGGHDVIENDAAEDGSKLFPIPNFDQDNIEESVERLSATLGVKLTEAPIGPLTGGRRPYLVS